MKYKVDNAIIMAAGISSRFVPISYEKPKALIEVKGEILIERQIRQLIEAGVPQIVVVVGYMKEKFEYLKEKFGVVIVENREYATRNNHSTIHAARKYLKNSYICSADNYFSINPFQAEESDAFYAAVYAPGKTKEWCITADKDDYIEAVSIGGQDAWVMLGHVFWTEDFSKQFLGILERHYNTKEIINQLWEVIYINNISVLQLKVKKYNKSEIFEFDSLEELREFDTIYVNNSNSRILQKIAKALLVQEGEIVALVPQKDVLGDVIGFAFSCNQKAYSYNYKTKKWQ